MTFSGPFNTPFSYPTAQAPVIPPPPAVSVGQFSVEISVDGFDLSSRISGEVIIEAEESTARIAEFTYSPPPGPVDINGWIGAPVTIFFVNQDDSRWRLFTGTVSWPEYDPFERRVIFHCTDGLQEFFESKTESEILSLITGGRYDLNVFGDRRDGWSQAEDVISTVAAGVDFEVDGATLVNAPWSGGSPLYQFSASNSRFHDLSITRRRDLINRIVIDAEYRYSREHHREHDFEWVWDGLCDFLDTAKELPTRDMWNAASNQLHWINMSGSVCFKTLPEDGQYCDDQGLIVDPTARDTLVIEAIWRAARRWTQTITEQYQITVQESGSTSGYGVLIAEDRAGVAIPNDDAAWDQSLDTDQPSTPSGGGLKPFTVEDCGGTALQPGQSWAWTDKNDEPRRQNFLDTLIAVANVRIRASHRRNLIQWEAALVPDLERHHWLRLDNGQIRATGKVYQYRHTLHMRDGFARTSIKLALSQAPEGGSDNPLTTPPAPDTTGGYTEPPSATLLPSYYGGSDQAPDYNPDWEGFTGNRGVAVGAPTRNQLYPRRVRVIGPDVEDTSRDEIIGSSVTTQEIQIIPDELVLA